LTNDFSPPGAAETGYRHQRSLENASPKANAGHKALMACLLPAVRRELSRRQQIAEQNDPCEMLIAKLDEMAARLRADPNWREPTAEEQLK
jgi:hypothetical protein